MCPLYDGDQWQFRQQSADGLPGQRRSVGGDAPRRSLRTFLAVPLGHSCSGGWRLELRQQLGNVVTMDAKLQGGLPLVSRALLGLRRVADVQ